MLRAYFGENFVQRPERSGLPSTVRGTGAVKLGLPSGVRGIPGVGWFNHWPASGALNATVTMAIREAFIVTTSLHTLDGGGVRMPARELCDESLFLDTKSRPRLISVR